MSGKSSQRKGRGGEIEICRIFQANGIPAEPGRAVSYGSTPDITGVAGIHCEIKRCQQLRIGDWMKQATEDAQKFKDGSPTIFFRRNREPWMVCMKLEDWIPLYLSAKSGKTIQKRRFDNVFSLDEVASALGCTNEQAAAEMEQLGISPIKASALPGFEWALGKE